MTFCKHAIGAIGLIGLIGLVGLIIVVNHTTYLDFRDAREVSKCYIKLTNINDGIDIMCSFEDSNVTVAKKLCDFCNQYASYKKRNICKSAEN